MKKIIALVLALTMAICAMSVCVFAYDAPVTLGLYFGDPDNGGWGATDTVEVEKPGVYTLTYEGNAKNLQWVIIKTATGNQETEPTSIPAGTIIRVTELNLDGVVYTFDGGSATYDYAVGANGTIEDQLLNIYTGAAHIDNAPATVSKLVLTFAVDPDNIVDEPAEEEAPAEEAPATEEEVEAPAEEEAPATEEAPAETGLALAVVPMLVAAAAVVISKKR